GGGTDENCVLLDLCGRRRDGIHADHRSELSFYKGDQTVGVSTVERLTVKCPACGRDGRLPSSLTVLPKSVRCPGCQTKFNPIQNPEPKNFEFGPPAYEPMNLTPVSIAEKPELSDELGIKSSESSGRSTSYIDPVMDERDAALDKIEAEMDAHD